MGSWVWSVGPEVQGLQECNKKKGRNITRSTFGLVCIVSVIDKSTLKAHCFLFDTHF